MATLRSRHDVVRPSPSAAIYEGVRVTFLAFLERAKIPIQIDIGFDDATYPTLLEFPGPRLLIYPRETVVAEKFEAVVKLGIANTRMKDFHDLEVLSRTFTFDGTTLTEAIGNTFRKRETEFPPAGMPLAFTPEFYDDEGKSRQWTAFCAKNKTYVASGEFSRIIAALREFLVPAARSARERALLSKTWQPGGPWL